MKRFFLLLAFCLGAYSFSSAEASADQPGSAALSKVVSGIESWAEETASEERALVILKDLKEYSLEQSTTLEIALGEVKYWKSTSAKQVTTLERINRQFQTQKIVSAVGWTSAAALAAVFLLSRLAH